VFLDLSSRADGRPQLRNYAQAVDATANQLAGFASFVDLTTVTFPEIAAPSSDPTVRQVEHHRCGSSYGESSARQLRGEALTDVIFNGSTTRKPTALASIELSFDNRRAHWR
jgi:chromosome segregation protein